MPDRDQVLTLTSEIVSAHARNNVVSTDQLSSLIQQVFNTLAAIEQKTARPSRPDPAVPIRQSVRPDHLVCLECGQRFSMLKRHLTTDHEMTPEQYRQRWGLSTSYPIVAANYAKVRSALAKKIGLGRKGRAGRKAAGRMRGR
jgi:predicted transcriptional regulator